jgi:hypothetical protein
MSPVGPWNRLVRLWDVRGIETTDVRLLLGVARKE